MDVSLCSTKAGLKITPPGVAMTNLSQENGLKKNLRHFCSLHGTVFFAGPSKLQSFPPLDGGGFVQVLVSVFTPPPHVTLHFDSDQSVYPPSTALIENNDPKFKSVFL